MDRHSQRITQAAGSNKHPNGSFTGQLPEEIEQSEFRFAPAPAPAPGFRYQVQEPVSIGGNSYGWCAPTFSIIRCLYSNTNQPQG